MKRMLMLAGGLLLLAACRKSNLPAVDGTEAVNQILKTQLSVADYASVDITTLQSARLSNGHQFYRLQMGSENIALEADLQSGLIKGAIYRVEGAVTKVNNRPRFDGLFTRSDLQRNNTVHYSIDNGVVRELHTFTDRSVNGIGKKVNSECADCTLPEVVVSSSPKSSGGFDWSSWLNLLWMFGMGSQNEYLAVDWGSGGGGGGGAAPAPVITIDMEESAAKEKIDQKKYTDCFGSVPDGATTLYTVTISSDLPTDGHPEIFYNWSDGSPGHAFIELSKSTPYGGVTQNFGFYPTSSYKLLPLDNNTSLASKIVDDGGHEYQARLTISVTAAQFQAAVGAVNNARDQYNVGLYNCTDFALGVFNAAGGNLSIPRHAIPGFEVDGGSNTPQGLYEKIKSLKDNGTAGATATTNKEYGSSSKGPCN